MPHGSVFGPLLFLFVNCLAATLQSSSHFFADDVKVVESTGRDDPGNDVASISN